MTASLDTKSAGAKHSPTVSETWDHFPCGCSASSSVMHSSKHSCHCHGWEAGKGSCIVAVLLLPRWVESDRWCKPLGILHSSILKLCRNLRLHQLMTLFNPSRVFFLLHCSTLTVQTDVYAFYSKEMLDSYWYTLQKNMFVKLQTVKRKSILEAGSALTTWMLVPRYNLMGRMFAFSTAKLKSKLTVMRNF